MNDYNPIGLAIPIFILLMVFEFALARMKGRPLHRYNDSVNSLSMGMCLLVSDALLKSLTFAVFIYLFQNYRVMEFETTHWVTWVVFFFGVDFCYYWFHRCAHEYNILWGAHVGHHQSEEYNLTTALRQSAFQYGFSWVFYLPLAILGCPPEVFLGQFAILKVYQFWLHTRLIHRIPLMEGWMSTPSSHRVHHAKNPIYIDRNYGGTLVIWDRLFGSWQPELEKEACHYGTSQPLNSLSPIKANLQHWGMLAKDTWHTKNWKDKIGLWFRPTGWRPIDCQSGEQMYLQHDGVEDRPKYNPQASKGANIYAGLSMVSLGILAVMFLFRSPTLDSLQLTAGVFSIVGGVIMLNRFLENRFQFWYVELLRWPVLLVLSTQLAITGSMTTVVNHTTIKQSPDVVFEYVSNPNRWKEWHFQSISAKPEKDYGLVRGDEFDEVIKTPLGYDDLQWRVIESESNQRWVANAYNPAKNIQIELKYELVAASETETLFTRTLTYEVPNFFWYAINAVYFKPTVSGHSQQALDALKEKMEGSVATPES